MTTTDHGAIDLDALRVHYQLASDVPHSEFEALIAEVEALRERVAELEAEKRAPVQGYSAGIPWSMHLRAYDVYCKRFSPQPALINLEKRNCRGGFGTEELDEFIPGWRDELSKTIQLLRRVEAAEARVVALSRLVEVLVQNDPDDMAADGVTVLDVWRKDAAAILSATSGDALERARAVENMRQFVDDFQSQFVCWGMMKLREQDEAVQRFLERANALDALGNESPACSTQRPEEETHG